MTHLGEITTRQTIPTVNRPTSVGVTSGAAFKMMSVSGNICPRCSKAVYSAEEVKAAGKVKYTNF
jgi:CxxC motif-containing protein